jgi:hypothetical protein
MFVNNTMWDRDSTEIAKVGDTEVWEIINLTADTHPMHPHLVQYQILGRQAFSLSKYLRVYGAPAPGGGPPLPYGTLSRATGFKLGGNPDVKPYLQGPVMPPDPNERGWKDTFRMNPGEVTRVLVRIAPQDANARARARGITPGPGVNLFDFEPWAAMGETDAFGYPGGPGYVWHCHIVDHEDNEMMRRFMVAGPADAPIAASRSQEVMSEAAAAPEFALLAPRPNPAAGRSTIRFTLPRAADADLSVYDVMGRKVATLASGLQGAGEHEVEWNAGNGAGLYFVRLRTAFATRTQRLMVVR